ncbi:hypothetical protein GG344DRAFT_69852 [Lentinula edodes]|nr:hypothetical protein GG344DRAFT_69852 [Lentinula edodes]
MWEKVALIGKILQECSFHDRMKHFRDELIEKMEERFDNETCRLEGRVKIMRKEAEDASKAAEKLKEKMEELVKDLETRGNAVREELVESEDGEVTQTNNNRISYATAAQAKSVVQHIQQPRHSPAIRDAEMRDRRIIIKSDVESDWKLTEKEIVTKANLAMDKMMDDEGVGTKMKVMAATKIRGNGAFLLMGSVAEAESMKVGDRLVRFCEAWGSSAILRPNYHEVVVESLPVETMIENAYERSCIEKANELPANSIAQIRWIKPIGKRRNDQ